MSDSKKPQTNSNKPQNSKKPALKRVISVKRGPFSEVTREKKTPPKKNISKRFISPNNSISKNTPTKKTKFIQCASVMNRSEQQHRCLFEVGPEGKFCFLHLLETNPIVYSGDITEIPTERGVVVEPVNPVIIKTSVSQTMSNEEIPDAKYEKSAIGKKSKKVDDHTPPLIHEHMSDFVNKNYEENEAELVVKLLILVNDEEYIDKIPALIGSVYNDVTLSDDEVDPMTLDPIWYMTPKGRVPAQVNKYFLFSYVDDMNKVRCLTVFTIYDMIISNNYIHPITMVKIPDRDIRRAKKLIQLYKTKLGMFKDTDESSWTPEFKLKNKLNKIFSKYHIHNIYLEDKWLISIMDSQKLQKIIHESEKIVNNSVRSINPKLTNFRLFNKPPKQINKDCSEDYILGLKEFIVSEWEKLVDAADNIQNQLPIWIIAAGLSLVIPEVGEKYPNLDLML